MNNRWPQHSFDEIKKTISILKSGKTNYLYGNEGELFEREFAKFSDTKFAVALSNGTVALDLAIKSLNLKKNSEILVTPRSFIASASCILLNNLKPKFIDVESQSHNISSSHIIKNINKKTSAIICVHLGGMPCNMIEIMQIAKKYNLYVIEDCSQAHGAKINNKSVGSFGDIATWSFCYDKIISTAGEGGMITTNNKKLYEYCWSYKDHGKDRYKYRLSKKVNDGKFKFLHDILGSNYRLTEIQSAIGRIQLKKIKKNKLRRNNISKLIIQKFKNSKLYSFQKSDFNYEHAYYRLYININKKNVLPKVYNLHFIKYLISNKISSGVGTSSEIYKEKSFKNLKVSSKNFKNSQYLKKYSFAIFVNQSMSSKVAKKIIDILKILEEKYTK